MVVTLGFRTRSFSTPQLNAVVISVTCSSNSSISIVSIFSAAVLSTEVFSTAVVKRSLLDPLNT